MGRYMRRGVTKVAFVPTISNKAAPTQAEINAGTDLEADLGEINGAAFANSPIETPNLLDTFTPKIVGVDEAEDPDLLFYERDDATTIWAALAKGTTGYLVFMPTGQASTKPSDVWPVRVGSRARQYSVGNDPARFRVVFSTTDPPVEGTQAA